MNLNYYLYYFYSIMIKSSKQLGFHKLSTRERIQIIKDFRNLREEDINLLYSDFSSPEKLEIYANRWGENVIGQFSYFPLRIAPNFLIDGKDYFIPMAIEEPSVVAAASYSALLAREGGGFKTEYSGSIMYGQIQLINVKNPEETIKTIVNEKRKLLRIANGQDQKLVSVGGGAKDIDFRPPIKSKKGYHVIIHLIVDVKDIMGANAVNTMVEALSPEIEEITGYEVNLRIISNFTDKRLAKSEAKFPIKMLERDKFSGEEVAERILSAYEFGANDLYRATTHNKGIMNGIDAVLLATGQDFRAVEAGVHSYAARTGYYTSLSTCKREADCLVVELELPMAIGIVGGVKDPMPDLAKKILGVETGEEFAKVLVSVGLAQNFGAIRALSTEGIQKGHMRLHAKQLVKQINAGKFEEKVFKKIIKGPITFDRALKILKDFKKNEKIE
jgi:hydroxymethylglutaryl-CoA reductase